LSRHHIALARVDRGLQAFIGDAALEAAFGGGDAFVCAPW
jgi:hypothetical protein